MADNDNTIIEDSSAKPGVDVEMSEGTGAGAGAGAGEDETTAAADQSEMPFAGEETVNEPEPVPERTSFISYLTSPIVTLIVSSGENETILTAHQALLTLSPFFKDACAQFSDDGSVSRYCPSKHSHMEMCWLLIAIFYYCSLARSSSQLRR